MIDQQQADVVSREEFNAWREMLEQRVGELRAERNALQRAHENEVRARAMLQASLHEQAVKMADLTAQLQVAVRAVRLRPKGRR